MNLPNRLTFLRIVLAFIFMFFLLAKGYPAKITALFIFIVAMITDLLDGKIARDRKMITNLGKLLDPLADKILVTVAFVCFVEMQIVPSWMVILIISREFCVTGLRLISLSKGKLIEASSIGKYKTVSQMVVILLVILLLIIKDMIFAFSYNTAFINSFDEWFHAIIFVSMFITVSLTMISGYVYIKDNIHLFDE